MYFNSLNNIDKYLDAGVDPDKIKITYSPSKFLWNGSKNCLFEETLELNISKETDPAPKITYDNITSMSLDVYEYIDVETINKSDGIIISNSYTDKYRFAYIPSPKNKNIPHYNIEF